MRSITKSRLGGQLAATILTVVLVTPGSAFARPAAALAVPFKGAIQMHEDVVIQFPTLFSVGLGMGEATQLGRFTVTRQSTVDLLTDVAIGSAQFIAADGSSVVTEFVAGTDPTEDPDVLLVRETYTITDGTGRFAGASGSFAMTRLYNLVTGFTTGSFDGTIQIPR